MRVSSALAALPLTVVLAVVALQAASVPTITADEARDYVGKRVTVCGEIVAIGRAFSKRNGGKQIFLHFDKKPPESPFTAVVIGLQFETFWNLDKAVHKRACATGYVRNHDGLVHVVIDAYNQLTFAPENTPR